LQPFDNWLNRTFVVWATCMALTVIISLLTRPPDPDRIRGMIWSRDYARLPEAEQTRNRGVRNLFLWWCLFVGTMAILYAYMIWFQFWGPASR
ncbi:MAG TPA: hypothetical protein PK640_13290, partial [Verrucomicrobiota bacterium]|nr:hypothetical protein [Verrucomicrobiota bacterium]